MLSFSLHAQNISLKCDNEPLKDVLDKVSSLSKYKFIFSNEINAKDLKVSIHSTNDSVEKIFEKLFKTNGISYIIKGNQVVLTGQTTKEQGEQKTFHAKGIVKDAVTGEPIPGAAIKLVNSKVYAFSDLEGRFEIPVQMGDLLSVSSLSMITKEIPVKNTANLVIELDVDNVQLQDVVVTGYQTISKERSAGSYAVVTTEKIEKKLNTNIMDRLEGMVVGMSMYKGKPVIRGTSTIFAEQSPLYVVDGVPFEGDIDVINPNDIVNVSVLKDATAASIYGARSTNGVIVITTRGGSTGKLHVNYSGSIRISPLPDRDYANLMSSSEFIDYQTYLFDKGVKQGTKPRPSYAINDVYKLLYDKRNGVIGENDFNTKINILRNQDRYNQVKEEFLNSTEISHQHNLSFNGGSDFYKYSFSLNYKGVNPYEKGQYSDRIGFNVKNNFNFTKWLQVDVGIMGSDVDDEYNDGVSGMSLLDSSRASYYMLRDENGNPVRWDQEKSLLEIDRLKSVGLLDESYYAVNEKDKIKITKKNQYVNLNLGAKFKILESLNAEIRYQTERENGYSKKYYSKDSYTVKNMINNATVIEKNGTITNHIPTGGQVNEVNNSRRSYTLRAQINYAQKFTDKHDVKVLVGAERRKVYNEQNGHYRFGYDDYNLSFKNIDEVGLRKGISGTQALSGKYTLYTAQPNYICVDDRYVSFYGNASYTYNDRLSTNVSIRMDQSNLFGTDPKYQYRPLWSVGVNYAIFKEGEVKWLDRLSARATYGINGNVYKKSGPFIISEVSRWPNFDTNESYAQITSPPNSALRWEKTKTLNVGIDFALFHHRLSGSLDYYNKKTSDMLGERGADPTFGWDKLVVNYGKMRNAGVEVVLESQNILTKDFQWNTSLLFSYNSNKLVELENSQTSAASYYGELQAREGKPFNSLYSIRYAGLDENGSPQAYKQDGTIVKNTSELTPEDLVYSGTYDPPYNVSLSNAIRYKGLELSFMFVYYGGHVMRDVSAKYYPRDSNPDQAVLTNLDRVNLNYWKQPGDEKNPDVSPAYKSGASNSLTHLWHAADKHIQKADYIKLRDLSLSYYFPKSLIQKAKISDLKVIFQAQNIWRWSANKNNLDPEVWVSRQLTYESRGSAIPPTFTIGVNLSF